VARSATLDGHWRATHRYARISPRKVRLVMDLIRGRRVGEAEDILRFTRKRGSSMISKVLKSAIANANEAEANVRKLIIADARVDEGPFLRRWRPKDRGRSHPILKRMSHITVVVKEK
jgi:large subunit ribosomal protein L22